MMENKDMPAYPLHPETGVVDSETNRLGLTKLEEFSSRNYAAILGSIPRDSNYGINHEVIALESIIGAVILLKHLEKQKNGK